MGEELSERQRAARIRHELSESSARAEAAQAQVLIDEFVRTATAQGLQPRPLKARTLDGHLVKTDKVGWYLRTNHSLAIGTDGSYYSLTVPGGLLERFRGLAPEACFAVGVTNQDRAPEFHFTEFRNALARAGHKLPVMWVDARETIQVDFLVKALLSCRYAEAVA